MHVRMNFIGAVRTLIVETSLEDTMNTTSGGSSKTVGQQKVSLKYACSTDCRGRSYYVL